MAIITTSDTPTDLQGILDLQQVNLPANISPEEALEQGFVTVVHNMNLLSKMNRPFPHTIAKEGDQVVGYTLVMLRDFADQVPVLVPMFEKINQLNFQGHNLKNSKYMVMGQVCVAKSHRGQGLFYKLYSALAERMRPHFDYIITDISIRNIRSLRAHANFGFQALQDFEADGEEWRIVIYPLNS